MSFDNRLIAARCVGGAWSLGEACRRMRGYGTTCSCVYRKPYPGLLNEESAKLAFMIALIWFLPAVLASTFKSKSRPEAENAVLRHQLIVLRRRVRGRVQPTNNDRWFLVQICIDGFHRS
jgi:hypothetical protein